MSELSRLDKLGHLEQARLVHLVGAVSDLDQAVLILDGGVAEQHMQVRLNLREVRHRLRA